MPSRCCVPGCKSNYDSRIKVSGVVSVFKFPKDEILKQKWLKAIRRKDWNPSKHAAVCKSHFYESDFRDSKQLRLKADAVPSVFPSFPKHMSKPEIRRRTDPNIRREKHRIHLEQKANNLILNDIISSFQDFVDNFEKKLKLKDWYILKSHSQVVLFRVEANDYKGCNFQVRIIIKESMEVVIFQRDSPVSAKNVSWGLPSNSKFILWSQIENFLACFKMQQETVSNKKTYIDLASVLLKKAKEIEDDENEIENAIEISGKLDLLSNQVELLVSKQPRYDPSTIKMAFIIYSNSKHVYSQLKNFMTFPCKRYLQSLSSSSNNLPNYKSNKQGHYISQISRNICENEKEIALLIDEVFINMGLQHKSKKLLDMVENNPLGPTSTSLAFMIKSIYGSFKEIVRLVAITQSTGNDIHAITTDVIEFVQNLNFKINIIIADNNVINQNLFKILCPKNEIFFKNPKFADSEIYIQYDTGRIFKNFRDNWLDVPNIDKCFYYPDIETSEVKTACFSHLHEIYNLELKLLVKQARKLNSKTLSPSTPERQNLFLVENLFHQSTIAALKSHGEKYNETAEFCELIRKWWDIVNTKSIFDSIRKQNSWSKPFYNVSDERLLFLEKFIAWLETWRDSEQNGNIGVLSNDTFAAAILSTKTVINFIKYSLSLPEVDLVDPLAI